MNKNDNTPTPRNGIQDAILAVIGCLSAVYLVYPSFSVFELIPDAIPIIGSLDEAAATALLLGTLAHFGVNITKWTQFFKGAEDKKPQPQKAEFIDLD